ncbi:MAG: hypothetical protein V4512_14090 [Pseudomonadota bacterium]
MRSVSYQLKIARFPAYRYLASIDLFQQRDQRGAGRQLHRCEFRDPAANPLPSPASIKAGSL